MRLRALLWLLLALGLAAAGAVQFAGRLPLQTNLLALLPATERNPLAEEAIARLADAAGNRAVFLIGGTTPEDAGRGARRFAAVLRESGAFGKVVAEIPPFDAQLPARFYSPYRFNLLGEAERAAFAAGKPELAERLQRKLYAPFSFGPGLPLVDDPFGVTDAWLAALPLKTLRLEPEGGLLVAREGGKTWAFVSADLPGSAYDNALQSAVANAVKRAEVDLRAAKPALEVLRTGTVFYAEAARSSAEREVDFIGAGSLAGMLLLLYLVFRSLRPLALGLLSVGFGIGAAVVATVFVYGELHLITLVFGASLIGESIDYAVQYFAAHLGAGAAWEPMAGLKRIAPGLCVALATSALGYAALMLAPFPALSQIALFALCGLGAAWLTVFLLLPWLLTRPGRRDPETAVAVPRRFLLAWQVRVGRRTCFVLCVVLLAAALPGALRLTGNDDVRLLVTRPPALQSQEERIRALAGMSNGSQFFLVEGDSADEVLRREERLTAALGKLSETSALGGFTGVSAFVPSVERQMQNRALWRRAVFAEAAEIKRLFAEMELRDEVGDRLIGEFKEAEGRVLRVEDWLGSPLSAPFRHLWLEGIGKGGATGQSHENPLPPLQGEGRGGDGVQMAVKPMQLPPQAPHPPPNLPLEGGGVDAYGIHANALGAATIVQLQGVRDVERLAAVAAEVPGVSFVDKAGSVSRLFQEYRQWGAAWLLGAVVLVYGVLCLRYGARMAAVMLAPTLIAIALAAGAFGYLGLPFTLFNLMGLVLVLGVGVNYAIFLKEGGVNAAATLAGVLLSAGTTLLSFGLLAFSSMPALAGFGLTLLTGISAAVLLAPIVLSFSREDV